jgi:hypothetical protein
MANRVTPRLARLAPAVLAAAGLGLLGPPSALGAPSPVALDSGDVALTESTGGGWTTSVGLTNLTSAPLAVQPQPAVPQVGCAPHLDHSATLPAAQHTTFKVTVPAACDLTGKKLTLNLVAGTGTSATTLPITAALAAKKPRKPDWEALWWFAATLGGGLLLSLLAFVTWDPTHGAKRRLDQALPYVGASWSFGGSWASNVTVAGGLLGGVLGSSSLLKQVLGDNSEGALALVTIAGAISAALIGAAGIIALTFQTTEKGQFTAGGLLVASAVALGAGGGQLVVIYVASRHLDLGGRQDDLVPALLVVALMLLALYGYRSLQQVFVRGTKPPPPAQRRGADKEAFRAARRRVERSPSEPLETEDVEPIAAALSQAEDALEGAAPQPLSALP